ncbi:MAG: NAD-binding oxidoreductase [Pseudomonadota bacterium]|nr:MAG: NAD-binding oxidoreductase [Pseudomonadota bacterium]
MSDAQHRALVLSARGETPRLRFLTLQVPMAVASGYRIPGQFVEISLGPSAPGAYFAMASPPGGERFELLVRQGEGVASELWRLAPGDEVWTSLPLGPGFPLDDARGKDVLLFATGSGFAPIRALLRTILQEREAYGEVHLFFGVRTEQDFPFRDELAALPVRGVHTHLTVSRRPPDPSGHPRYVQEKFREVLPEVKNAVAYMCGIQGMVEGVTEELVQAGMPRERIHVNL